MINNSTPDQFTRASIHFMADVAIEDADTSLQRVFAETALTERKLQSMVVYLGLDVDLESAKLKDLRRYIGSYLHKYYPPVNYSLPQETTSVIFWLTHISNKQSISEEIFNFLYQFDRESLCSILIQFRAFQGVDINSVFCKAYPIKNTICYLCDSSMTPTDQIAMIFDSLKNSILNLKIWDARINWFKSGSQLNQKKIDAANAIFLKQKIWPHPIYNIADVRNFFYSLLPYADKELIFRKIRANYLNKKSREESNAKQCNFSLQKSSENMIDEIARKNGVTRSIALNAIFYSGNQKELQELFKKGIQNLPVQVNKSNSDLPKLSFTMGLNSSTMAYKFGAAQTNNYPHPISNVFLPNL